MSTTPLLSRLRLMADMLDKDTLTALGIENDERWPGDVLAFETCDEAARALESLTRELEEAKEALKPFADAANTLDMEDIEGFPFDDPREVLWAGEGGTITVAEFRRAQALVTRLSRARSDSTETEAPAE